jgi:hypothetical protein
MICSTAQYIAARASGSCATDWSTLIVMAP